MPKGRIEINEARCKGCSLCTVACPQAIIVMRSDYVNAKGYYPAQLVDPEEQCTGCALCAVACPDICITVYRQIPVAAQPDSMVV
jgi:2-oxoglutarate ferredoxin oxidoreductase subunit delta